MLKVQLVSLITVAFLLGEVGCSVMDDDVTYGTGAESGTSGDAAVCEVGEMLSCDGCDSGFGFRVCKDDQSAFEECRCYGSAVVRFCHTVPHPEDRDKDWTVTLKLTADEWSETFTAKTNECDPASGTGPCTEVPAGILIHMEYSAGALGILTELTLVEPWLEDEEYIIQMTQPSMAFPYYGPAADKIDPITWGTMCSSFVYPDDLP